MKNLGDMMKQVQAMQERMAGMQAKLEQASVTGQSGGGLVKVTLNGKGDMRGIHIDPKIVDAADTEMLQDLIVAAHRSAKDKVEAAASAEMQKVTGGLQLPPGMKLPF